MTDKNLTDKQKMFLGDVSLWLLRVNVEPEEWSVEQAEESIKNRLIELKILNRA